jgi:hypothetical protein
VSRSPIPARPGEVAGLLGLALDGAAEDLHLTRTDHVLLLGGSAGTHEWMQELAFRFEDELARDGRPLAELPLGVVAELLRRAGR